MMERKCPECGEMIPAEASVCPQCGCPLPAEEKTAKNQYAMPADAPAVKKQNISKSAVISLVIGILIFVMGATLMGRVPEDNVHTAGSYPVDYSAFGGDFYTEIYGAVDTMADALSDIDSGIESVSRAAQDIGTEIYTCSGMLIMAIGLMTIAVSLPKIKKA